MSASVLLGDCTDPFHTASESTILSAAKAFVYSLRPVALQVRLIWNMRAQGMMRRLRRLPQRLSRGMATTGANGCPRMLWLNGIEVGEYHDTVSLVSST